MRRATSNATQKSTEAMVMADAGNKRGAGEFHGSRQHEAVDESDDRFECAEREQGVAYFVHRFTTGFGARACRNGLEGFVCAQTATGLLQAERAAYQKRNGKNRRQGAVCGERVYCKAELASEAQPM